MDIRAQPAGGALDYHVFNADGDEVATHTLVTSFGGTTSFYTRGEYINAVGRTLIINVQFGLNESYNGYGDNWKVWYRPLTDPTITPTPTASDTPGPTNTVTPYGTQIGTQAPTSTPGTPAGGTPTPNLTATTTGTRLPVGVFTLPPPATLPPPLTPNATGTAIYGGTATAGYYGTETAAAIGTGTAIYDGTGTPVTGTPTVTTTIAYVPWGDGGAGDGNGISGKIALLASGVFNFGQNIANQAFGYVRTIETQLTAVLTAWNSAPPTAIPGLPNCVGDLRLASEVCAVYYIITYTILSGTLGALIIPLATAVIVLVTILVFIKRARAIAARIGAICSQ